MAISGHLLLPKRPGSLSLTLVCPTQPTQCNSRARMTFGPITASQLGGGARLWHGFMPLGGISKRRGALFLGLSGIDDDVVAASGDAEAREAEVLSEEIRDEVDPEENSSFPAEFKDLILDRGDSLNLFLYAAGFCLILLMRDVILEELAGWGINFARVALYMAQGITIGLGKLTNVAAKPLAFLLAVVSWAIMAVDDIYTLIVDGAPVRSLFDSFFLSLAVLSIGDAATSKVKGSRSRLVGISTAIGLAGVLEFIPPLAILSSLALLTAFAKFIQKADPVTMFMPATVSFVTISEPILQAAALGIFFTVSMYANWRDSQFIGQSSEQAPSQNHEIKGSARKKSSFVFLAITASICISLAARLLYLRSVNWLLLRST